MKQKYFSGVKTIYENNFSKEYDSLGNPWFYRGKQLEWSHGRQLDKFADIAEFTYNASGIRTSKIANGFTTKYYLLDNKIVRQYDDLNTLDFYYGADGLIGFHLLSKNNDDTIVIDNDFYYKKNIQGDIIGIIDSNGKEIVKYVYDAWGKHKAYNSKTGDLLDISSFESYINTSNIEQFIAIKNPFRYRGYYYDFETSLYYLNSRYYDPETGRFINADNMSFVKPEAIGGINLYSYCTNNPIMNLDTNGNAFITVFLFLLATTLQAFSVGAVAFNISAFFAAPIAGIEMQGIDFESPTTYTPPVNPDIIQYPTTKSIISNYDYNINNNLLRRIINVRVFWQHFFKLQKIHNK